ncbi:MAG: Clp1/GlmU family protein, partial [Candidatus Zipacnadales bacterium]
MTGLHAPSTWEQLAQELSAGPSTVMVVGAADSGKSTFCRWLAAKRAASGHLTWLIDADVGQSHLGPPATIACGQVTPGSYAHVAAFFVGDISPRRVIAPMLEAFALAVRTVVEARAEFTVVDTTGWVADVSAVALKLAKANLLQQTAIVLIETKDELRALRRGWRNLNRFPLSILQPVPQVICRSPAERRVYREASFRAHLEGAIPCEIDLRQVAISGSGRLHLPHPWFSQGLLLALN